ncbi:MAG: hypothetical protein IPO92_22430 [Saprospiraceae bacterium]|nr:hypothetical protein [Saprospiraceae bacterium]
MPEPDLEWSVIIDLWADEVPDFEYSSKIHIGNDILNIQKGLWKLVQDDNGNGIPDIYLKPATIGELNSIQLPPISGKKSYHIITWTVYDKCQNVLTCVEKITVLDNIAPSVDCIEFVFLSFMTDPDGNGPILPLEELYAIDLISHSIDNCTDKEDLLYTFDHVKMQLENKTVFNRQINIDVKHYFDETGGLCAFPAISAFEKVIEKKYYGGEDNIQLWDPTPYTSSKVFSTNIRKIKDRGKIEQKITVWDKRFNSNDCTVSLSYDLGGCYFGHFELNGNVRSLKGNAVSNAIISLNIDNVFEYPKLSKSSGSGLYYLFEWFTGLPYKLSSSYIFRILSGVNKGDLNILRRHLNGIKILNDPFQMIAADINGDRIVDKTDLFLLEMAIINKNQIGFSEDKVIPKSPDLKLENWFAYKDSIILSFNTTKLTQDFVAIKIGDIDGSAFDISGPMEEVKDITLKGGENEEADIDYQTLNNFSVTPNPFLDKCELSFDCSGISKIDLLIEDLTGKIVYQTSFIGSNGLNKYYVDKNDLKKQGIYLCTLKSGNFLLQKKLMLL